MDFDIPTPPQAEEQPNELTRMEMADLSDKKRGTILYERIISTFENRIEELNTRIDSLVHHNNCLITKDSQHQEEVRKNGELRRAAVETTVSFALATLFMAIGGALISSYPLSEANTPWQFAAGWAAIVSGCIFGITSRALAWLFIRFQRA